MKVSDVARYVRSKNAGPFWITADIFCDTKEDYDKIRLSPNICPVTLAKIFKVPEGTIKIFHIDHLNVIKISYPRSIPQGGPFERDMHAGQQYLPVLDIEL